MIFEILLVISVAINAFLVFYAARLARRLFVVAANIEDVYNTFDIFRQHVEQIHEAEMFYGDQTLQTLIDHSKEVLSVLENYEDLMEMVIVEEEEDEKEE